MAFSTSAQLHLGSAPLPTLLWKLSWPAIASNLINSLYTVIDQIFIGQTVGYLGNAALTVVFPLFTLVLACSALLGSGGAAAFTLAHGAGETRRARTIVQTSLLGLWLLGVVLGVLTYRYAATWTLLFGATTDVLLYTVPFLKIIALGFPFFCLAVGGSTLVRADTSSQYAMIAVVSGALLNLGLDALFIGYWHWGMIGAAWATVWGQLLAGGLILAYLPRFRSFPLALFQTRPTLQALVTILSIGISPFTFQLATAMILVVTNSLINEYGSLSPYGANIPLATVGIVSKIHSLFVACVMGIVQGAQPIFSYNYGAKNFNRIRGSLQLVLKVVGLFSLGFWLLVEIFPQTLLSLFGILDPSFYEFATYYMRVYFLFALTNGLHIVATTFFTTIGKGNIGAFLAILKRILLLWPALYLGAYTAGLLGMIWASPFADGCAVVISLSLLYREWHRWPTSQD